MGVDSDAVVHATEPAKVTKGIGRGGSNNDESARDAFNFFDGWLVVEKGEGDGKRRIWVVQSWNLLSLNTNTWY